MIIMYLFPKGEIGRRDSQTVLPCGRLKMATNSLPLLTSNLPTAGRGEPCDLL